MRLLFTFMVFCFSSILGFTEKSKGQPFEKEVEISNERESLSEEVVVPIDSKKNGKPSRRKGCGCGK